MKIFWRDLRSFWRVLRLRGLAREAWHMVTATLTHPGSFASEGLEVGAQVFPPGSKWGSSAWCLPASGERGRVTHETTTTSTSPTETWNFNLGTP